MRVGYAGIRRPRHRYAIATSRIRPIRFIRYVGDAEGGHVGAEADLPALVVGVRAVIDHALDVVRVARPPPPGRRILEAAGEGGLERILDIDHVEAATAGGAAHDVGKASLFVDGQVMRLGHLRVVRRFDKSYGRIRHVA